jgi:predicted phage terminase large subunit-like protein
MIEIRPQAGPQSAFCASEADIAIYGGAAGGGKSFALVLEALKYTHVRGYAGVLFRRTSPELVGGGSLWETMTSLAPLLGGSLRSHPQLEATFPRGSLIELRHLQHEHSKLTHQGKQYAFIGFDELTHFEESQFWYLVSRMRSTSGVRPFMRATCNPDPDSFVRRLIDWWIGKDGFAIPERSGVVRWFVRDGDALVWGTREELAERFPKNPPMSLTFVPAKLADNPILTAADPSYEAKLNALGTVDRERLRDGNWNTRAAAGLVFRREWFQKRWVALPSRATSWMQSWDMRFSNSAQVGAYVCGQVWCRDGADLYLVDQIRERLSFTGTCAAMATLTKRWPKARLKLVEKKANGEAVEDTMRKTVGGIVLVEPRGGKIARAQATSPSWEAGNAWLPANQHWVDASGGFVDEHVSFPDGKFADQVDTASQAIDRLLSGVRVDYAAAMEALRRGR